MTTTGIAAFDATIQATNVWLHDIMMRLGWADRDKACRALRAVLHALRDRLNVDDVAHLSAQLPLLVRGMYYEGWHPAGKPVKEHRAEFLSHIEEAFRFDTDANPEQISRAVLGTIERHVTPGEVEKIKGALPKDLRALWP